MTSLFDTSAPKLSRQFGYLQPCLISLSRKRFNAHLIVVTESIFFFSSSTKTKARILEKLGAQNYFYVLLGNVFSCVIKLPTQNVFKGVSDKVTCHGHVQIFLRIPCEGRRNMPLLQHPKRSPTTNTLPCKITQSAIRGLCISVDIVGKSQYPSYPSVCSHASMCLPLEGYLSNCMLEAYMKIIPEDSNL